MDPDNLVQASRRFTAVDSVGRPYAVTEFVHVRARGTAPPVRLRSWRLDSGEWVNACADDRTLICMRTGMLLRRMQLAPSVQGSDRARPPGHGSTMTAMTGWRL